MNEMLFSNLVLMLYKLKEKYYTDSCSGECETLESILSEEEGWDLAFQDAVSFIRRVCHVLSKEQEDRIEETKTSTKELFTLRKALCTKELAYKFKYRAI